jgi:GntR family transcriptional regulator / MocR family aminotransferase
MDYSLLVATYRRSVSADRLPQQRVLYECLRAAILDGTLAVHGRLPATRTLADELGMARNSVLYAYERLADEGWVLATRHGTVVAPAAAPSVQRGPELETPSAVLSRRVRNLRRKRERNAEHQAFVSGVPALDRVPLAQWRGFIERAWRAVSPADLGYGNSAGHPALRQAVADYLRIARGVRCSFEQVFITDGTQTSLDLCARLFADAGEYAWVENPGYNGARAAFQSAGLNLVPVPVDADGCAPPATLWRDKPPKLVYVTPSHQYPLGSVLSLERRLQLIDDATAASAWIIEDDYDSEFRREGPPLPAVQGLARAALRIGYMVVPPALTAPVDDALGELARRGRLVDQVALAEFIESGAYALHLRRMRRLYAQRCDALRDALDRHTRGLLTVSGGAGGMHLSARLDVPVRDVEVAEAALAQRLVVQPISGYDMMPEAAGFNGFVLGYAGVPVEHMDERVAVLARVIEAAARGKAD